MKWREAVGDADEIPYFLTFNPRTGQEKRPGSGHNTIMRRFLCESFEVIEVII